VNPSAPESRPWNLAQATYAAVKDSPFQVAVLPLGATEPHTLHLPYATDTFQVDAIGQHVCRAATQQGAKVVLLPTIPYGTETNLRGFPLALNVNPSTLQAVIKDLVDSLVDSGILKIVLLNGHGGNDLKPLLRELYGATPAHLFLCNWYQVLADAYHEIFDKPEDHAGEMETSLALAYFPDYVARSEDGGLAADAGAKAALRFEALEQGWVSITRPWKLLTTNSGAGDPHAATAEKGHRAMQVLVDRLAPFLSELSDSPLDERFPF